MLHRNVGLFIKLYLMNQPRVVVCNVRYFEPDAREDVPDEEALHH
jgi:hypothetical protein